MVKEKVDDDKENDRGWQRGRKIVVTEFSCFFFRKVVTELVVCCLFLCLFQKSCYRIFLFNKFALTWFFAEFDQAVHQLREAGIQVRSS